MQFLLSGDLLPNDPGPLRLPDADRTCSPNLDTRCWRLINDFVCGPESWGLAENRRFIDQLAKNAFNEILLSLWPWQSFVHYEFRGVAKSTGCSWFGFRYPVDEHTVGRELFGGAHEFENPDLAGIDDYHERHAAARRLATGIIEHAAARGIGSSMSLSLLEYPREFLPVIPGAHVARQLAEKTCVPGSDQAPDDPLLVELARTKISAHLHTYPGVERLFLGFPEHREWLDQRRGRVAQPGRQVRHLRGPDAGAGAGERAAPHRRARRTRPPGVARARRHRHAAADRLRAGGPQRAGTPRSR